MAVVMTGITAGTFVEVLINGKWHYGKCVGVSFEKGEYTCVVSGHYDRYPADRVRLGEVSQWAPTNRSK